MQTPLTWIVRFDIDPVWVADGFVMSDTQAIDMLSYKLEFANVDTELAAQVIAGPSPLRIAKEQGYDAQNPGGKTIVREIIKASPAAYSSHAKLDRALIDAITLLDSVAFVRDEKDNTQQVLDDLRKALAQVRGASA